MSWRTALSSVLLLAPLAALLVWVAARGKSVSEDPAAVLKALRVAHGPLLPGARAVGAASRTDPSRYDRETLSDLIDGAADAYLSRGFVACVATTYAYPRAPGPPLEVSAEAHRFESAAGADAQLRVEKPPGARAVAGFDAAVTDGAVLVARSGTDLLKLTALSPGPGAPEALASVATAWRKETTP